jgi:sugar/nucleoside kinase (ribokinase family)
MVKVKICALGSASQDVFISGKGIEAKFDAKNNEYVEELKLGAKLNVDKIEFATGGGATNAATTFARQGLESSFIGRLGRDVSAQNVIAELDQENIDSSDVIYDSKDKTQYSTVLLAENGERTILIYRGASDDHKLSEYQEIDFRKFDWLYVSSFGGAVEVLDFIFSEAHAKGVKIFFNPGALELKQAEKLKGLLEDVNVLLVNKEEAQTIVNGQTLEELVRKLKNYVEWLLFTGRNQSV